jgi:hypothetical protein
MKTGSLGAVGAMATLSTACDRYTPITSTQFVGNIAYATELWQFHSPIRLCIVV